MVLSNRSVKIESSAVDCFRSIVARLPQRELDIRRRCASDAHFRSVCADYEEALMALRYWQKVVVEGDQKVAEYLNFLDELEAEILEQLDRPTVRS